MVVVRGGYTSTGHAEGRNGPGLNLGKKKGKEMRRKTGALVDPQTGERTVESVGLNSKDNLWN